MPNNTRSKEYLEEKSKIIVKNLVFNAAMFFCYFLFDLYHHIYVSCLINLFVFISLLLLTRVKDRHNTKKQVLVFVSLSLVNFYFSSQCGYESGLFLYYFSYLLFISLFFNYENDKREIIIVLTVLYLEILLLFITDFSLFQCDIYTPEIKKTLFKFTVFGICICTIYYSYLIHIKQQLLLKYMHKTNVINTKLEFLESRKIVGESDLKTLTDLAVKGDKNFFVKFEILYSFYCEKLLQKCPDLTQRDLELCAYLKLNYSTKEIANCTKSSVRAIESRKYRIRKKFNIPKQDDMNVWMMNFENTVKSQKLKQLPNNDFNTKKIELQKFADFSPYPLIISENRENKIINVFLNDIFIDEIGYDLKDIPTIDEWFTNAYPDEKYKNEVIAEWTKKATEKKENEYVKMKAHITRKDNKKNWYEIKSTVINDINIVLLVDIDKEIQFQAELKRINKNNDKILSIIGHDLKTPIANLMSLSSLFKSGDITESEFLEMVEAINEGSTETLGLLDNTLNWAKLNFEEIQTKNEVTNIKNIITPIIEVYKTIINNKKITFNLNLDKKFEANSDPELVTIIIRNIIPNAIKFTPENGIITVKTLKNKISITDNGVGMSDDKIASILRKNYSSENGTENEVGFGIGLQLVMNVCEKLNCKLNINSIVNEGTKISVVF